MKSCVYVYQHVQTDGNGLIQYDQPSTGVYKPQDFPGVSDKAGIAFGITSKVWIVQQMFPWKRRWSCLSHKVSNWRLPHQGLPCVKKPWGLCMVVFTWYRWPATFLYSSSWSIHGQLRDKTKINKKGNEPFNLSVVGVIPTTIRIEIISVVGMTPTMNWRAKDTFLIKINGKFTKHLICKN